MSEFEIKKAEVVVDQTMSQFAEVSPRSGSDGNGERSDARVDDGRDVVERLANRMMMMKKF